MYHSKSTVAWKDKICHIITSESPLWHEPICDIFRKYNTTETPLWHDLIKYVENLLKKSTMAWPEEIYCKYVNYGNPLWNGMIKYAANTIQKVHCDIKSMNIQIEIHCGMTWENMSHIYWQIGPPIQSVKQETNVIFPIGKDFHDDVVRVHQTLYKRKVK